VGCALLVVGCVLGLAIDRSLWALGPIGELYGESISRTLEVGGRSDSRIPFVIVQLVAHGTAPFSDLANSYFSPFDFSSRGPLAGLASAQVVLAAAGARRSSCRMHPGRRSTRRGSWPSASR
jgi:hypothetical protein